MCLDSLFDSVLCLLLLAYLVVCFCSSFGAPCAWNCFWFFKPSVLTCTLDINAADSVRLYLYGCSTYDPHMLTVRRPNPCSQDTPTCQSWGWKLFTALASSHMIYTVFNEENKREGVCLQMSVKLQLWTEQVKSGTKQMLKIFFIPLFVNYLHAHMCAIGKMWGYLSNCLKSHTYTHPPDY